MKEQWCCGYKRCKKAEQYKCKSCKYQFTKNTTQEYPTEMKLNSIKILKEGFRFRVLGKAFCALVLKLLESGQNKWTQGFLK